MDPSNCLVYFYIDAVLKKSNRKDDERDIFEQADDYCNGDFTLIRQIRAYSQR